MSLLLALLLSTPVELTLHDDGIHHDRSEHDATLSAQAPTGTAHAGVEFLAQGQLRYETTEATFVTGTVQAGSCLSHFLHYVPGPASSEYLASVKCTVPRPGPITTHLEACIDGGPCALDIGEISVR